MDRKPRPVLIDYARDELPEDNSDPNPALPSKIPNGGWIVLGVLFVCSMFIVHAFINHAYNRDYEETYTIASSVDETPSNPQLQLEVHQHDSEYIDGLEFNVYEIEIQDDDSLLWTFIQSSLELQGGDELKLSSQSISRASNFRFSVTYPSSDGLVTDSFSCTLRIPDCDEDGDGWLYDSTWGGDDVYFCNCGTFYDHSMKIALPDGDAPTMVVVDLHYHQDDFFSWLIFEAVFILGLVGGVVLGKITESKHFTRTVLAACTPIVLVNSIMIFGAF